MKPTDEQKFEKLDAFLKENRPEAAAPPADEYQGILRQIRRPPKKRGFVAFRSPVLAAMGSLAALYVAWMVVGTPMPSTQPPVALESFDAENFIASTVSDFYEAEETDLAPNDFGEL